METEQHLMESLAPGKTPLPTESSSQRRRRHLKQVLMVSATCLSFSCVGSALTWPSPALYDLSQRNETLFSTTLVLSPAEKDMTGSLPFCGILVGSLAAAFTSQLLGRRKTLHLTAFPFLLGWLIVGLSPSAPPLLVGRFLKGVACGMVTVSASVYVLELADKEIRGFLQMLPPFFVALGSQYTLWLGTVLPWYTLSLLCTVPPILLLVVMFFLCESPSHLVIHGRCQEAAALLKRLRGRHIDVAAEVQEIEEMNAECKKGGFRSLFHGKLPRRVLVLLGTFILQHMCGTFILIVQAGRVLQSSGSALEPDTASGLVLGMRLIGTVISFVLIDRVGRRWCLIISHFVIASSLSVLGIFVYLTADNPNPGLGWVPLVCVTMALLGQEIGVHHIPFVLAVEYFPTSVRTYSSAMGSFIFTVSGFIMLQLYSPLQDLLTQAGLYWFFASSSLLGIVFTVLFVTETKKIAIG